MNIKKNLQAAALMLAVTFGTSVLVGSYMQYESITSSPVTNMGTNIYANLTASHAPDNVEPGTVADIVINAQESAEVGELVRFDVSESTADSFKWVLVPNSIDFEVYDEGQRAVFSARHPGEYMFIVGCAYQGTIDIVTHIVTIEGGDPGPPNPPDPPHPPNPNIPDVRKPDSSVLFEWVAYWCSQAQRSKYETLYVAGSFEGVAAQISAGVLTDTESIIEATVNANRQALGDSITDWLPVLREIQTELKSRAEAGILVTPEQHAVAWREIAKGMRSYAALFDAVTPSNAVK